MDTSTEHVDGLVSVVVPTRDNERTIDSCLASVRAQTHVDVELIVVDNHSTDATPGSPSGTPTASSPPAPSGPRSATPASPRREGSGCCGSTAT
ncbi:glycosyltransferase [Allobranchiibius sp. GilTou73]|uniref:glycosyltransferase family 2 protein n=1 Tax=Allobranchiibius sp. GilTou73 TaxID=2904523 RepID=UPI0021065CFA|nr:glycosyltransferase [Allobranchiibius sp. GilTou73]